MNRLFKNEDAANLNKLLSIAKFQTFFSSAINATMLKMSIIKTKVQFFNIVVLQLLAPCLVISWDLSIYNISSDYYASNIAVFGTRAFLSLPRTACKNNYTHPTLVEVSWNEFQNIGSRYETVIIHYYDNVIS